MKILDGTYFITGVTGFIGSLVMKSLLKQQKYKDNKIKIIGLVRDPRRASNMYQDYDCKNVRFICSDLLALNLDMDSGVYKIEEGWKPDYIIHCAATTRSAKMINNPVDTADGIVIGTRNILDFAQKVNVKSMVYISSMEVYGTVNNEQLVTEDMLGGLDIFSVRSCYPLGKRMAEHYCYSYHKEYNTPVKIARLSQTFGEGILPDENRAFFQFACAAVNSKDIVLHTNGNSMGNYCDSYDTVEAIFLLLYEGVNGEAYNVVNEANTMCIREMANLVANQIAHNKIKVVFDIPEENKFGYAAQTGIRLSSAKIRKLGWKPKTNLVDMYMRMINWIDKEKYINSV
ncbi:nucleotide sugar dehydratase [Anaerocolumna cellulosilytica]|uniref:Nucleotide sugar dehydratase n=1 Tax=Anaerocolumna cellulosilytica TaxID=433286 RepID=A0A6S6QYL2_9FIRM|nr:NAD(P)-dependent oxidoreductase [Anaerocolumna cellulosilytica]MBB5195697.1 nucleoside-diphosphate-sugar epimerase [Anaerocolumna cellulosilytica]BCJ92967.1 nucleotide sugar dehydratase [Anaerocolumna cellulosilytica]